MKYSLLFLLAAITLQTKVFTQEVAPYGKPSAELFADFHKAITGTDNKTGFSIKRAYFGYTYFYNTNFSGSMIVDIGTPEDLSFGSKPRRYAHFREASISYNYEKLNITLGITGTKISAYQQKFWGKRYLALPYQSLNGYGTVADLGLSVTYKISSKVEADFTAMNGEGYSNIQADNFIKYSGGLTLEPIKSVSVRLYADHIALEDISQTTLVGFAGVKNKIFNFGAEFSFKSNLDKTVGHHAWGISGTGGIYLTEKNEIFGRMDYSTSVTVPGEATQWNYTNDGIFVIGGLQHTFNPAVKISLNYQIYTPEDVSKSVTDGIYVNALFKF